MAAFVVPGARASSGKPRRVGLLGIGIAAGGSTELAAKARLPAIYQWPHAARDGGLLAYGPRLSAIHQQRATLAARILGGAKAGDRPIERPTNFELVVNKKTAKALGLASPPSLPLRADEVIR